VWWWRLIPPTHTTLLSSTRKLWLDREERVPSLIAHHVHLHKIIPLSPFLFLALITSIRLQIFNIDLYWIIAVLQIGAYWPSRSSTCKENPTCILQIGTPGPVHQCEKENPICNLQIGTPGPIWVRHVINKIMCV
jgi:hypothetical protein